MNRMLRKITYQLTLVSCLLISFSSFSQDELSIPEPPKQHGYMLPAEIVNGDTIAYINLPTVWVLDNYAYKNKKTIEQWTRTKYNVKKVYPYAILAAAKLKEYDRVLQGMPEYQRSAYLKVVEKQLRSEFEDQLKNLTVTQGRILLKLIDRETGKTSYQLVKDLRGSFQAFMWQSLARLFGSNMKSEYDPTGEDMMIERAIRLVEAGQI